MIIRVIRPSLRVLDIMVLFDPHTTVTGLFIGPFPFILNNTILPYLHTITTGSFPFILNNTILPYLNNYSQVYSQGHSKQRDPPHDHHRFIHRFIHKFIQNNTILPYPHTTRFIHKLIRLFFRGLLTGLSFISNSHAENTHYACSAGKVRHRQQ